MVTLHVEIRLRFPRVYLAQNTIPRSLFRSLSKTNAENGSRPSGGIQEPKSRLYIGGSSTRYAQL